MEENIVENCTARRQQHGQPVILEQRPSIAQLVDDVFREHEEKEKLLKKELRKSRLSEKDIEGISEILHNSLN